MRSAAAAAAVGAVVALGKAVAEGAAVTVGLGGASVRCGVPVAAGAAVSVALSVAEGPGAVRQLVRHAAPPAASHPRNARRDMARRRWRTIGAVGRALLVSIGARMPKF